MSTIIDIRGRGCQYRSTEVHIDPCQEAGFECLPIWQISITQMIRGGWKAPF